MKDELGRYEETIDKRMGEFLAKKLKDGFGFTDKQTGFSKGVLETVQEYCLRGGKRIRGSLVFVGYTMAGGEDERKVIDVAVAMELIHAALLAHDDFMDQDELRRGGLTLNALYTKHVGKQLTDEEARHHGDSMAVDVGDVVLMMGFELLGGCRATALVARRIMETALGQAFDVCLGVDNRVLEDDVLALHRSKTGLYTLSLPLELGATLAGADDEDREIIRKFATPLGIAFQLRDDVLGLYGDIEETGKANDSDLKQGKNTLLVVKAMELAGDNERQFIMECLGNRDLTGSSADEVRKIVKKSGALEYSNNISMKLAAESREILNEFQSRGWNSGQIKFLGDLVSYLVERDG